MNWNNQTGIKYQRQDYIQDKISDEEMYIPLAFMDEDIRVQTKIHNCKVILTLITFQ